MAEKKNDKNYEHVKDQDYLGCSLGLHLMLLGTIIIRVVPKLCLANCGQVHCFSQQRSDDRFQLSNAGLTVQSVVPGPAGACTLSCTLALGCIFVACQCKQNGPRERLYTVQTTTDAPSTVAGKC